MGTFFKNLGIILGKMIAGERVILNADIDIALKVNGKVVEITINTPVEPSL